MTPTEAYEQIAALAREHALIHQAAGGVIVVVHPDTQRREGIYDHCQYVAGRGLHPSNIAKGDGSSAGYGSTS